MRLKPLGSWLIAPLLAVVSLGADSDRRLIEAAKKPDVLAVRALLKQGSMSMRAREMVRLLSTGQRAGMTWKPPIY